MNYELKMAKWLLMVLLSVVLCLYGFVAGAQQGNAVCTLTDGQGNPLANEECVISFFSVPQDYNGGTAVQWRGLGFSGANGVLTLTNLQSGNWQVRPVDPNTVAFSFYMPVTNGTIYVQQWGTAQAGNTLPGGSVAYDIYTSDLRYATWSALTNALLSVTGIVTNGGSASFSALTLVNPLSLNSVQAPTNFTINAFLDVGPNGVILYTNPPWTATPNATNIVVPGSWSAGDLVEVGSGDNLTYSASFSQEITNEFADASWPVGALLTVGVGQSLTWSTNAAFSGLVASTNITAQANANMFYGTMAGNAAVSGAFNTAAGYQSLLVLTSGSGNTAFGEGAIEALTGGSDETAVGQYALGADVGNGYNTAVGEDALSSCTSGAVNTALGTGAGLYITTGSSNIDINNFGQTTDTNIIRIGTHQTAAFIAGNITMPTNSTLAAPASLAGYGIFWNSNNALYWVTKTHTNYIAGP